MHEYSIASAIMDTALEAARGKKIVSMTLRIGALSGVFDESLLLYIEVISEEKKLGQIDVKTVNEKARFACACGHEYDADEFVAACPSCHGYERRIVAGTECTIESIEVEENE
jgi:hydrogenase nickel incorporation protein HypA/HybF